MKRSTMFLVGAAGVTLAAWGAERSINRPSVDRSARAALPPECVLGADGKMPDLPQCKTSPSQRSSSSNSYSRSSYFGGGWGRSSSDHTTSTTSSGSHGPSVSRGGFGSSSSSFTSSGS